VEGEQDECADGEGGGFEPLVWLVGELECPGDWAAPKNPDTDTVGFYAAWFTGVAMNSSYTS
jgi:hypothetical protein